MPVPVRAELQAQLAPYRDAHPGVRWTRPESWHLTLLFLGSVDPRRVPELRALLTAAAAGVAPYQVRIEQGDGRLRGGDGVAWLGLNEGAGTLIDLASSVAGRCPPGITEGSPPKRTPSAHLTLVRRADEGVISALRDQGHGRLGVGWTVDRIELMRSHLEPGGARHETLCQVAL